MSNIKVGDKVLVKKANIDRHLVGKRVLVREITEGRIYLQRSVSYWIQDSENTGIELVEPLKIKIKIPSGLQ